MKRALFYLFVICLSIGCSKSGTETSQEAPAVSQMMEETPEDSGDSNSGNGNGMNEQGGGDDAPTALMGEFMNGAHPTSGTATVNVERTKLELKDFKSDDGPILELYLATDIEASQYETLGELQGLEGDFTYDLPGGIDYETHKYVLVWCVDFSVSFGHAILE